MLRSAFLRPGRATGCAAAAVAVVAAVLSAVPVAAQATQPQQDAVTLHEQLLGGRLGATHGVHQLCRTKGLACRVSLLTTTPDSLTPLSTADPVGYAPDELARAYDLPSAAVGARGTIAILDAGAYPNLESDLATYRERCGLPSCTTASGCLKVTDFHGGPPLTPGTSILDQDIEETVAMETALDVDMASAACPHCKILVVQVPDIDAVYGDGQTPDMDAADFGVAANTAVGLGANVVSVSYGYPSDPSIQTGAAGKAFHHPGVAMVASSGDGGFEGGQHTDWPQSLPWVTSVGGTSLYSGDSGAGRFTEQAWSGSGSGCQADTPAAVGQSAAVSRNCGGHRAESDISAVADPATGVAVYETYAPRTNKPRNWVVAGGTSASAPFVAGLYARGGHTAGVEGPNTLYAAPAAAFRDITVGQNAPVRGCESEGVPAVLCNAGPGWDGPTGLGSPRGLAAFRIAHP